MGVKMTSCWCWLMREETGTSIQAKQSGLSTLVVASNQSPSTVVGIPNLLYDVSAVQYVACKGATQIDTWKHMRMYVRMYVRLRKWATIQSVLRSYDTQLTLDYTWGDSLEVCRALHSGTFLRDFYVSVSKLNFATEPCPSVTHNT